ncbi:hypothetical protein BT96DRAFT_930105 [Gymnopus androsaceus JB14]|uniref:HNH nuclease domain-containing protein n=1 Tax=Gymnopus androsaceus JB14 TaxID=1447944 RepID=A0A6A4GBQ2_9AGAR|nr:hypothetical protein BT96DRAFT_930105 [Gymnopus androsaceus JB14]
MSLDYHLADIELDDDEDGLPSDFDNDSHDPNWTGSPVKTAKSMAAAGKDTSPRNIRYREAVAETVRKNLYAVSPDKLRCVITLVGLILAKDFTGNPTDVEACHGIEKGTAQKWLRVLEWYFGLDPSTLNVNSRWNIILLRSDIHKWYDSVGFILIPTDQDVLNAVNEIVAHNSKCQDPRERRHFQSTTILKQQRFSDGEDTGDAILHKYPFNDVCFQSIESHLNPFYALAHARHQINKGMKRGLLNMQEVMLKQANNTVYEALQYVITITENWEAPETIPESFRNAGLKPPTPTPPSGSRRSGTSRTTASVSSSKRGGSLSGSASRARGSGNIGGRSAEKLPSASLVSTSSSRSNNSRS